MRASNLVCCFFFDDGNKDSGKKYCAKSINTFMIPIRDLYHHIVVIRNAFKASLCTTCRCGELSISLVVRESPNLYNEAVNFVILYSFIGEEENLIFITFSSLFYRRRHRKDSG